MTFRWTDLLATAALAVGFAAVGEAILRRRSRDLVSGNESFLVGMAVCGAGLLPLSLLFPRSALRVELALMGACLLLALFRRARGSRSPGAPLPRAGERDFVWLALVAAVVVVAADFTAVDLRYSFLWDGFQIWASKAQFLYDRGALDRLWYPGDTYELRYVPYPPLVPLYEALLQVVRGQFDFDSFKPVFLPFYYSLLVATYGAARAVLPARLAAAATLMLALLPLTSTGTAAGAYADMPQAAFVAGVVAAALRRTDSHGALPWLIGGLTVVKPEGTIIAVIAGAAVAYAWWIEKRPVHRLPWGRIAIVAVFLALRLGYVRWASVSDSVYVVTGESLMLAARRIPHVAHLCLVKMLSPRRWGLLWPAFGLAALVLGRRGSAAEASLAVATAVAAALFAVIFLFTTWPVELHIDQAYPRLLAQISPAAVVAALSGWRCARRADVEAA
ncbi:MAG TPA: hypothetical protein VFA98_01475 [Thermoanaerobaculia bacterium]|nr:hypothetical protein [Thermoanaerobaculia bacterium]